MSYTCPRCGAVSHNPHDENERYCGRCHEFEDEGKNARVDEIVDEVIAAENRGRGVTSEEAKALETLQDWARKTDPRT